MAIKISGSTIIDDSRVIVNADKIGIGTPSPTRELSILSPSPNPTGIGVSAANSQSTDVNKAISVFNAGITSTFAVSYTGIVTANEYFGTFKGNIDPGVPITNAAKIQINHNSTNDFFSVPFFTRGLADNTFQDIQYDDGNSLQYNPSLGNLKITSGAGTTALIIKTTNNSFERAISFQNSGNNYVGYLGMSNIGSDDADMVFGVDLTNESVADNVSERMRITNAGNVGIGSTIPGALLNVYGTDSRIRLSKSDAGTDLKHWDFSAQGEILRLQAKTDANVGGGNLFDFHRVTNQVNEFRGVNSANTWFVVDNLNQEVGIGTDNPEFKLDVLGNTRINRLTAGGALVLQTSVDDATDFHLNFRKARGGAGTLTTVQDDDELGTISALGYSAAASNFVRAAQIRFAIDGVPDSSGDTTDMPGRLEFYTTPDGDGNPAERLRINSTGDLLLGAHGSRIFDDSSGTNVVVDIYGGTTAGKRGILALGGRTGSDDADIGTIQFVNENNNLATAANHVQSKLVASIDVKSETTDGNAGSDSGGHLLFSTKPETGAIDERLRIDSNGRIIQNYAALPSVSSNLPYAYFAPTKQSYGGVDLTMNLHDDTSDAVGNGGGIGFSANSSTGSPIVRGAIRGNTEATNSNAGYLTLHTRGASGDTTEKLRITSTGEVNIGGDYTQTTNKLNVTGDAYVSDDIIVGDEIRNNTPSDFWASDNTFINLNAVGNLTHMGGFEVDITSNGYRDTNGQWVGLSAGGNGGAAQIGLQPQGSIVFRTDATKANGSAHNPTLRLTINSDGDLLRGGTGQDIGASSSPWDKIYANEFIGLINTTQTNVTTGNLLVTGISTFVGVATFHAVGIGTDSVDSAKLEINVGSAVTALDIQGSEGQLFSVTNNLTTGSIFAVNDVSGTPSINVDADGTIQLAPFLASDKVGIGTTNPAHKLDVIGDALVNGTLFLDDTVTSIEKITGAAGYIDLYADSAIRLYESDDNRLGITFDINQSATDRDVRMYFLNDSDTYLHSPADNTLGFKIGNTDTLRLAASKVGVNVTDPHCALDVRNASGTDPLVELHHSNIDTLGEVIRIGRVDSDNIRFHSIKAKHSATATSNQLMIFMHDGTNTGGTGLGQTEAVRIRGDGRIGIGTDSIDQRLTVQDSMQLRSALYNTVLFFQRTDTNANGWIGIPNWNPDALYIFGPTSSSNEVAAQYESSKWIFSTGGNTALTIKNGGSVNIGGDYDQTTRKLKVTGDAQVTGTLYANISGTITPTGDVDISGNLDVDGHTDLDNVNIAGVTTFSSEINLPDSVQIQLGNAANGDFVIVHDSSDSILNNATGDLFYRSATHRLQALNGTDRLHIDSSGRILIGHSVNRTTRTGTSGYSGVLQIESDSEAAFTMTRFGDAHPSRFNLQHARGTIASIAAAQNDDDLGQISFSAYDGSNFTNGAEIIAEVDGIVGVNSMPGRLIFKTTPDNSAAPAERVRIEQDGKLRIGTVSPILLTANEEEAIQITADIRNSNADNVYGIRIDVDDDDDSVTVDNDRERGSAKFVFDGNSDQGDTNHELRIRNIHSDVNCNKDYDQVMGFYADVDTNHTSGTISNSYGLYADARHTNSGTISNVYGILAYGRAETTATSDISNIYGVRGVARHAASNSGNTGNLIGVRGESQIREGTVTRRTATNAYSFYADLHCDNIETPSEVVSGRKAMYFGDVSGSTNVTGLGRIYGLYLQDATDNYLSGNLQVVGVTTTATLDATTINATTINANSIVGPVTGAASLITVADESSDTACFPVFATAATGNQAPKTGSNLTFNSSTGELGASVLKATGGTVDSGTETDPTNVAIMIEKDDYIYTNDSTNSKRRLIGKTASEIIEIGQTGTALIDEIKMIPGNAGFFSVKTGETEDRFVVDSNGNIGVNAIPRTSGTIFTTVDHFLVIGDNDTGIAQDGDGQFEIWANNQEIVNFNTTQITPTKSFIPSVTDASLNLGSSSNRWGTIYATTIDGTVSGAVSDIAVTQEGRSAPCYLPITVTGTTTKTIGIATESNAFGAKYVQVTEPTGSSICDGDLWYDTSGEDSGGTDTSEIVEASKFFQNPTSLTATSTFPASGTKNGGVFGPYTIAGGVTLTISSGSTFTIL